jgi:hypothetical protein
MMSPEREESRYSYTFPTGESSKHLALFPKLCVYASRIDTNPLMFATSMIGSPYKRYRSKFGGFVAS